MKQFTQKFLFVFLTLLSVFAYYTLKVKPEITGDLGALGEIPFGTEYSNYVHLGNHKNNLVNEYEPNDTNSYEVISVGDSFSQQGIAGYQNYLAHYLSKPILNINYPSKSPEQNAIDLLKSGFLQKKGTKVLIVQTAERAFFRRVKILDFNNRDYSKDSFYISQKHKPDTRALLNRTTSWIRLSFNFQSAVRHASLNENLFTHKKYENDLFFYYEDLNFEPNLNEDFKLCHENLSKLNSLCNKNGIKLIYVLAAIKYDIYYKYITEKKFIENPDLIVFNKLDNSDFFINTYSLLQPYVDKKVKDIYMVNDTHWSPLGHKIVAQEILKRIKPAL